MKFYFYFQIMENELTPQGAAHDEVNLLDEQDYQHFVYATQGQRFLNWLIDNIITRLALAYAVGIVIGLAIQLLSFDTQQQVYEGIQEKNFIYYLITYSIVAFTYLVYYTACEKLFKGYTLGKVITGTKAIRQDGGELTFRNALLRSLCRIVPFEVLSGFSTLTWHDSWTDTMVIKSR